MTDVIVSIAVMLTRSLSTSTLLISLQMSKREIEKSESGKIAEKLANGETWLV